MLFAFDAARRAMLMIRRYACHSYKITPYAPHDADTPRMPAADASCHTPAADDYAYMLKWRRQRPPPYGH